MKEILLDTHAWAWSLTGDARLSTNAYRLLEQADLVFVSPISFVEIGQKVHLGKWEEMTPFVGSLPELLEKQGGRIAALGPDICLSATTMDWKHRDPFDRLLAASAVRYGLPLVSADLVFDELDGVDGWPRRFW